MQGDFGRGKGYGLRSEWSLVCMKKKEKRQYYLYYTFLFICIATVIAAIFWLGGKSFVWAKDGAAQHYPVLVYIHDYLTQLGRNLLRGDWELPMVDFSIGEGMDVLTTLNYYGFGDPLTLAAAFCPRGQLEMLYGVLIFVRLYLAGLFFSMFCFDRGGVQKNGVLLGALSYTFCGYAMYASVRHPFFVNGMLYLPLYLLGVERILRKRRYGMFSIIVALSLISNFYFGYMNTIMAALYALFLVVPDKGMAWKEKWGRLFSMAGAYLWGVGISAGIMLPIAMAYLGCSRGGEGGYSDSLLVYPKSFYLRFLQMYICPFTDIGEWTNLSFSLFCLAAVVLLFAAGIRRKKPCLRIRRLQTAYILLTLMLLIPLAGKVMNGFGYVSNRWNYGYAMLNSYILACMYPVICKGVQAAPWILPKALRRRPGGRIRRRQAECLLCLLLVFNLAENVSLTFLNPVSSYMEEFVDRGGADQVVADTAVKAAPPQSQAEEGKFYRVEQPWHIGNQSLAMDYYGHSWYFSIAPENYFTYYNSFLLNSMERTYSLRGLDGRSVLNELSANRYYVTSEKKDGLIPYGYQLKKVVRSQKGETEYLYENQKFLPLGYTVSAWIREKDYSLLSPIEKQQVLMQSVLLEEDAQDEISLLPTGAADMNLDGQEEFCKVASCAGITWENNRLSVNQENATIELTFSGRKNCETYLWFNKFQVIQSAAQYQVGAVESDNTENYFVLMNPKKSAWYDEPDQTINLGYSRKRRTSCKITFPKKGVYSLDNFMVYYEPMDSYGEQVAALRADRLEKLAVGTNRISGEITLSKRKLLQMAVPYSTGWTAWVDGKKARIYRSNYMYMAVELPAGCHQIEFRYETPYLKEGLGISCLSLAGLFVAAVLRRRIKRGKDKG